MQSFVLWSLESGGVTLASLSLSWVFLALGMFEYPALVQRHDAKASMSNAQKFSFCLPIHLSPLLSISEIKTEEILLFHFLLLLNPLGKLCVSLVD